MKTIPVFLKRYIPSALLRNHFLTKTLISHIIQIHLALVDKIEDTWPEQSERSRKWVTRTEARSLTCKLYIRGIPNTLCYTFRTVWREEMAASWNLIPTNLEDLV